LEGLDKLEGIPPQVLVILEEAQEPDANIMWQLYIYIYAKILLFRGSHFKTCP